MQDLEQETVKPPLKVRGWKEEKPAAMEEEKHLIDFFTHCTIIAEKVGEEKLERSGPEGNQLRLGI